MTAIQDKLTQQQPLASTDNAALPAGGPAPQYFDWAEAWHPVHYVEDLDKSRPTRFTLLEQDLVIWWDPNADTWRVFADECPHRLAPLSEGRVNAAGQLECPYHGWAFSGEGKCEVIPQLPADSTANESSRACAQALPTAVRQGMLFVYPGNAENAPQVEVPVIGPMESDPDGWVMFSTFRDLPYDALTLLENVLDSSHIPYTHHKSVGDRKNAAPMVDLEILETGKPGFYATWPEGPRRGQLGQQFTTFVAPNLMWHDVTSEKFGRTLTVVYATPIRKGECRLFARFPFKFNSKLPSLLIGLSPRWYTHLRNNGVLEDDQIFLHLQERALATRNTESYGQACYMPSEGDRFVVEFRRWVRDYAADPFPNQPLPREWNQVSLLDRYHSHTQHCGSCRPALKRVQQLKRGSLVLGAIALCLSPVLNSTLGTPSLLVEILYSLLPVTAGGLWLWLNNLEQQFFKGREIAPRNLPEK